MNHAWTAPRNQTSLGQLPAAGVPLAPDRQNESDRPRPLRCAMFLGQVKINFPKRIESATNKVNAFELGEIVFRPIHVQESCYPGFSAAPTARPRWISKPGAFSQDMETQIQLSEMNKPRERKRDDPFWSRSKSRFGKHTLNQFTR